MQLRDFIKIYENKPGGYCPCIIDAQGELHECPSGHLNALFALDKEHRTLSEVPADMSPLFYMIHKTGAIAVDYEGQLYDERITPRQQQVLDALYCHGMILKKTQDIHKMILL